MTPALDKQLDDVIRSTVKYSVGTEEKVGLLFSGGVDSAVLAVVARKFADVTLYVAGTPGSHDMIAGQESGYVLDLPVVPIIISKRKVLDSLEDLVCNHGLDNPKWATALIAFNIIVKNTTEDVIMSGQGADEQFGGYRKYADLPGEEAMNMMDSDLSELLDHEKALYHTIVNDHKKTLAMPFLEPAVVEFSSGLPFGAKLAGGRNKVILRDTARLLGVPVAIAERKKKAIQYGTGVSKILKAHLKEKGVTLPELMAAFCQ